MLARSFFWVSLLGLALASGVLASSSARADATADREKARADFEDAQEAKVAELKAERKKQRELAKLQEQKLEKLNQKKRMARTAAQVNIIKREAGKLEDILKKAERRIEEIDAELERLPAQHEQARLRFLLNNPLPGDPKYVEDGGVVYTPEDFAALQQLRQRNATPEVVADRYVERLLADGTVETAQRTGMRPFQLMNGPPEPNTMMVFYKCRYVSKAGLVNDREGYVMVNKDPRGFWGVSSLTHLQGMHFE
jgi:DNA gyrase/topoisomerase IV subunit A